MVSNNKINGPNGMKIPMFKIISDEIYSLLCKLFNFYKMQIIQASGIKMIEMNMKKPKNTNISKQYYMLIKILFRLVANELPLSIIINNG